MLAACIPGLWVSGMRLGFRAQGSGFRAKFRVQDLGFDDFFDDSNVHHPQNDRRQATATMPTPKTFGISAEWSWVRADAAH